MRATRRWPPPVNSRPTPCPRSPSRRYRISMYRIILFLLLIALAAVGAAWMADQTGDVALSWDGWRVDTSLPVFALALGVDRRRGDAGLDHRCARCGACRNGSVAAGANAVWRGAGMPSPTGCSRSAMAIRRRPARMPMSRAATPATIHWRCCCMRNRRSSTATAPARKPPFAPWPNARIPGCSACAGCSSRRSAPTIRSPRSGSRKRR